MDFGLFRKKSAKSQGVRKKPGSPKKCSLKTHFCGLFPKKSLQALILHSTPLCLLQPFITGHIEPLPSYAMKTHSIYFLIRTLYHEIVFSPFFRHFNALYRHNGNRRVIERNPLFCQSRRQDRHSILVKKSI